MTSTKLRGSSVGLLEWPLEEGKGIDDRLAKNGPDRVLAAIETVEFGTWKSRLLRNDRGRIMPCYENVALFLENSAEWAGVLGYNEFTAGYFVLSTNVDYRRALPSISESKNLFGTRVNIFRVP